MDYLSGKKLYGTQKIAGPSLLDKQDQYGESPEDQSDPTEIYKSYTPQGSLGAGEDIAKIESMKAPQEDLASVATKGTTAAAIGGPAVAGITVAGSLLSNYLAQKAADERAKRERIAQSIAQHGHDEQSAISQIMANNARALR